MKKKKDLKEREIIEREREGRNKEIRRKQKEKRKKASPFAPKSTHSNCPQRQKTTER